MLVKLSVEELTTTIKMLETEINRMKDLIKDSTPQENINFYNCHVSSYESIVENIKAQISNDVKKIDVYDNFYFDPNDPVNW
jgi:hypothetical protein